MRCHVLVWFASKQFTRPVRIRGNTDGHAEAMGPQPGPEAGGFMHRSRGLSAALVLSTAAGLGLVALPQPAAALTAPVAFTADDLPTWQTNGIVWALAEAGGTVFAGGTFSQVRPPEGEAAPRRTR